MNTRRAFLGLLATIPVSGALVRPAMASSPMVYQHEGVAINGYDPVAYFTDSAPVYGDDAYRLMWGGAIWRFATAENLEAFEMNPSAYAPQYGGYCAYAVSRGAVATTEPDAWTIHEGKLFLNYNLTVRGIWSQDIAGNVALADNNWPNVLA